MNYEEFVASLKQDSPPEGINDYLKSLWFEKNGSWEASHNIAQDIEDRTGSRIHAYLHRREGDNSNARYWYNRAGMAFPAVSMDKEWEQMVKEFLK